MLLSLNDDETLKWEGTPPQGIAKARNVFELLQQH